MLKQNENQRVDMNFHDAQKRKNKFANHETKFIHATKTKINSNKSPLNSKTRIEGPRGRIKQQATVYEHRVWKRILVVSCERRLNGHALPDLLCSESGNQGPM